MAHALERPYVEGAISLIKITDAALARLDASLPPDRPSQQRAALRAVLWHTLGPGAEDAFR